MKDYWAQKTRASAGDPAKPEKTAKGADADEIVLRAMKCLDLAIVAEGPNRAAALEDLRFLTGDQWPDAVRREREQERRPCLSFNQLPKFTEAVMGDARQNKPGGQVHPVDGTSDPEIAKIFEGLIRDIEYRSIATDSYDCALEQAVNAGWGYFRILTDYCGDDTFEQEILIKRIPNQFSVYMDPSATEADFSDGRWALVTEKLSLEEFEERFGEEAGDGDVPAGEGDRNPMWFGDDWRRVAEFWWKKPVRKRLAQIRTWQGEELVVELDGEGQPVGVEIHPQPPPMPPNPLLLGGAASPLVPPEPVPDFTILRERKVETHQVCCYTVSGGALHETQEWAGKYIPIIPVLGKEIFVDGERYLRGMVRNMKDPQQGHNYWMTMATETIALQPKAPWTVTATQIEGHEAQWNQAHAKPFPYLLYNIDPDSPQSKPTREQPPALGPGMFQMLQISAQGLKDTSGIYDASLGAQGNEQSGVAITARQREGDASNFYFIDNLSRSLRHAYRILVDLIPKIYDSARIVRVMGKDEQFQFFPVNQPVIENGEGQAGYRPASPEEVAAQVPTRFFDLSAGRYDVRVSVGPAYATKRIEAANSMMEFVKAVPAAGPLLGDLIAKNMDWEGADEVAQRLQVLLPPQAGGPQPMAPPAMPPGPGGPGQVPFPLPPGVQ